MTSGPYEQWGAGGRVGYRAMIPEQSCGAELTARHAASVDEVVRAIDEVARLHYHYYYCSAVSA